MEAEHVMNYILKNLSGEESMKQTKDERKKLTNLSLRLIKESDICDSMLEYYKEEIRNLKCFIIKLYLHPSHDSTYEEIVDEVLNILLKLREKYKS